MACLGEVKSTFCEKMNTNNINIISNWILKVEVILLKVFCVWKTLHN